MYNIKYIRSMSASETKFKMTGQGLPSNVNELPHKLEIKCKSNRVCAAIEARRVRGSEQPACPYLQHILSLFRSSPTAMFNVEFLRSTCEIVVLIRRLKIVDTDPDGC